MLTQETRDFFHQVLHVSADAKDFDFFPPVNPLTHFQRRRTRSEPLSFGKLEQTTWAMDFLRWSYEEMNAMRMGQIDEAKEKLQEVKATLEGELKEAERKIQTRDNKIKRLPKRTHDDFPCPNAELLEAKTREVDTIAKTATEERDLLIQQLETQVRELEVLPAAKDAIIASKDKEIAYKGREAKQLMKQVMDKTNDCVSLCNDLDKRDMEIQELKKELALEKAAVDKLHASKNNEVAALNTQLETANKELEKARKEPNSLRSKFEQLKSKATKKVECLQAEIEKEKEEHLVTKLDAQATDDKCAELTKEITAQNVLIANKEEEISKLMAQRDNLRMNQPLRSPHPVVPTTETALESKKAEQLVALNSNSEIQQLKKVIAEMSDVQTGMLKEKEELQDKLRGKDRELEEIQDKIKALDEVTPAFLGKLEKLRNHKGRIV